MPRKTKLTVAGKELEFASLNFKDIGERVAKSQECEARGYHVRVSPSQQKMQKVGLDKLRVDLCADCGIWTLDGRFR